MKLKSFCSKYIKFTSSLFIAILAPKPSEGDTTDKEWSQSAGQTQQETLPYINSRVEFSVNITVNMYYSQYYSDIHC